MGRNTEMATGVQNSQDPLAAMKAAYASASATRYTPQSTLDSVMPNQNGLGTADLERRRMGVGQSANGLSQENFDKNLWIRQSQPTARYDTTFNANY